MTPRFILFSLLAASPLAGLYFGASWEWRGTVSNTASLALRAPSPAEEITMVFVGDVMLSRAVGKLMADKDDYLFPFASTTEVLRAADIAFANLENPISERGATTGSVYSFRADPRAAEGLVEAGFDVVSVANNHIWDYGREAFLDTLSLLESGGIVPVGGGTNYDEAHRPKVITMGKTRVAFLAYSNLLPLALGGKESVPAIARYEDDTLEADIARARELADVVVVSLHWGEEYKNKHNAEQERVARHTIDAGATLIVGHHPHVVQEVEEYRGGLIAYSLGNFVLDQNFSSATGRGLVLFVTLTDGKISEVIKREVAFTNDYRPYFVESD